MKQKKFANLNLNQSLEDFQASITQHLKLNNIKWSGIIIKDREEKIREAALTLAGQCVAILLDKLSQSREAIRTAIKQTKGWWKAKTRKNGFKTRTIFTKIRCQQYRSLEG